MGDSGCIDVNGPDFTEGLLRCPLEGREENLDSTSYPQDHKKKGTEKKDGMSAQGAMCVKKHCHTAGTKAFQDTRISSGRQGSSVELFTDTSIQALLI